MIRSNLIYKNLTILSAAIGRASEREREIGSGQKHETNRWNTIPPRGSAKVFAIDFRNRDTISRHKVLIRQPVARLPEPCSVGTAPRTAPWRGWRTSSRDWIEFLASGYDRGGGGGPLLALAPRVRRIPCNGRFSNFLSLLGSVSSLPTG